MWFAGDLLGPTDPTLWARFGVSGFRVFGSISGLSRGSKRRGVYGEWKSQFSGRST